jgi:hypothetical protein
MRFHDVPDSASKRDGFGVDNVIAPDSGSEQRFSPERSNKQVILPFWKQLAFNSDYCRHAY